jgi:membrane-associated protein
VVHLLLQAVSITQIFDPTVFLRQVGSFALIVVAVMVLIETGLLFPFLPGDSLVFAAALLAPVLGAPLWVVIVVVALAAILGGHIGYAIGSKLGPRLFKPGARVFKPKYHEQSVAFVAKYGVGAIVLARFVPIVRTFAAPVVGMSSMPLRKFALWNAIGAVAWSLVLCFAGFWLGKIPLVAHNVEIFAVIIVVVSVLPVVIGALVRRSREKRARANNSAGMQPARES